MKSKSLLIGALTVLAWAVSVVATNNLVAAEIYFTTGGQPRFTGGATIPGQVQRVNTDGTGQTVIIADTFAASGAIRPHGIAVDTIGGKIYYTTWRNPGNGAGNGLHFANLDGSSPGNFALPFAFNRPFFHTGVAVDNAGGKLYGSNGSPAGLFSMNLDGTGGTVLNTAGFQKGEVELDLVNGHVYWTSGNDIFRANLDGSSPTSILNFTQPRGLELDLAGNTIYFTQDGDNANGGAIYRVDLDGSNLMPLLTGVGSSATNFFMEIELDPATNQLYFTDTIAGNINRINADGSGFTTILSGLDTPDGLDLVVDSQPIPEPTSLAIWSLLAMGGAGYGWRKRRRAGGPGRK